MMGAFLVYILKSGLCVAAFYLFYRLLMSRETFHRFNRMALLGVLSFSVGIPLLDVSIEHSTEINRTMFSLEEWFMMMEGMEVSALEEASASEAFPWILKGIVFLYVAGILFFFFRHLYSFRRMFFLIRRSRKEKKEADYCLFIHQEKVAPFSWMRFIVLSEKDWQENGAAILTHERAHVRMRHSWDLLIADFCLFFQWFNPAAWLLKQELQQIHEYEADEDVIRRGIDAKRYQLLLIEKAVGTRLYTMANSLNHSSLKKRITMMLKKKSNPWARAKYLYVLPLAAVTITVFARPEVSNEFDEISRANVYDFSSLAEEEELKKEEHASESTLRFAESVQPKEDASKDEVYATIDETPMYPGGMGALTKFLSQNIVYPTDAASEGKTGRVIVGFIVEKDGTPTDIRVFKGTYPSLDEEALRVVSLIPKWIPGKRKGETVRSQMLLPIVFRLAPGGTLEEKPLYMVNGVETNAEEIVKLDADQISSMRVWKDIEAIKRFGERAKGGVVDITLKEQ